MEDVTYITNFVKPQARSRAKDVFFWGMFVSLLRLRQCIEY